MNKFIFPVILMLALASCKKSETAATTREYGQIKKALWLEGRWEHNTAEGNWSETWTIANDSTMLGASFMVIGKDTVFAESVRLAETKGSLSYIVSVPGQNKEQPVAFGLTKSTDNQLVFENPKHDFPNKIVYRNFQNDSLVAEIYGIRDNKTVSEIFPMVKIK